MAQNMAKASERVFNGTTRVDVASLSPSARTQALHVAMTSTLPVVQNTTKVIVFPMVTAVTALSAYVVYTTIPAVAGGTATIQIDTVAADGTTVVNIVAATSILGLTNKVPLALTLAATNPTSIAAGASVLVTVATSNNVVGTADVGGGLSIGFQRVDPNPITD